MTTPRRVLVVTWDGGGTIPVELALARRLARRGHHVRVLADPTVEAEACDAGCDFVPWRAAPHRATRDRAHTVLRDYEGGGALGGTRHMVREFMAAPLARFAADASEAIDAWRPDVALVDYLLPGAVCAVEAQGVPRAVLIPNINMVPARGVPPMGPGLRPMRGPLGWLRDTIVGRVGARVLDELVDPLNAERGRRGLPPVTSLHDQALRAERVLVQSSPAFDFSSPHLSERVTWVGAELDDPPWAASWSSPWPPTDRRPLVVVALSSTYQAQESLLGRVVDALRGLDVRALVTLGPALDGVTLHGAGPLAERAADGVVVVRSAPHAQVLAEAAACVTHCGHGTTMKALAAGVPLVCAPMGRDQNDNAARVVHHGAGVRVAPDASARRLRDATRRVLRDPRYRAAARRLGAEIRARSGCHDPVALIESLGRDDSSTTTRRRVP